MNLIFATHNEHKLKEIRAITSHLNLNILSLSDLQFTQEIEETGSTLDDNAVIKAKYIYQQYQENVFGEDTGLEVDALNGQPGVKTARYAGPIRDSNENMDKLLSELKNSQNRNAQFRSIIALILDDKLYTFEGITRGQISMKKKGTGGFGYDPVFIPDGFSETFAELDESTKNQISHRARAMQKLIKFLDQYFRSKNQG